MTTETDAELFTAELGRRGSALFEAYLKAEERAPLLEVILGNDDVAIGKALARIWSDAYADGASVAIKLLKEGFSKLAEPTDHPRRPLTIVDIARHYGVEMHQATQSGMVAACCPFHSGNPLNRTLHLNPIVGFYQCFKCSAHGNAIDFVMAKEACTFGDAIDKLAALNGMPRSES